MKTREPDYLFVTVPNSWSVYKVKKEALDATSIENLNFPTSIILDALVKSGLAEVIQNSQIIEMDSISEVDISTDTFSLGDDDYDESFN
jgi:uncharacterized Tic20 family protein